LNPSASIVEYIRHSAQRVENYFQNQISHDHIPPRLLEAISYSFLAGGKRLRPTLVFAANEAVGGKMDSGLPAACAIEMIHTYSLIHDDLPAMDNDDYRRGKLTNHKVYGEAMAILAGDGLLTHAFHVLSKGSRLAGLDAAVIIRMVEELSTYAGIGGMVGGQVKDLEGEKGGVHSREQLESIHLRKTSDLMVCALRLGGLAGGATEDELSVLTQFGYSLGLAFQIQDDILDVIGDEQKMGKKVGSDEKLHKATYPALIGLDQSIAEVNRLMDQAKYQLEQTDLKRDRLLQLANYILQRDQ
jgi:geranylgeranyl diphosphate synthase type II